MPPRPSPLLESSCPSRFPLSSSDPLSVAADVSVIGVPEGALPRGGAIAALSKALGPVVAKTLKREEFTGKRDQILEFSTNGLLKTFRETMSDGAFGEGFVGGARPERWRHVFASIQSLASYGVDRLPTDHFDLVVVDEFHHAAAKTYHQLLQESPAPLEPVPLGLTATPERGDGVDVRGMFDGRTAYELRLWDALAADLLVPFHYFGVADDVDLTKIEWKRGAYDVAALDRVYTGNDARAAKVLEGAFRQSHQRWTNASVALPCLCRPRRVHGAGLSGRRNPITRRLRSSSTESIRVDALAQLLMRGNCQLPVRGRPVQRGTRLAGRRHDPAAAANAERHDLPTTARPWILAARTASLS